MKSLMQILNDPRFRLVHNTTQRFSQGPENAPEIRLTRTGFDLNPALKKKSRVYKGMTIAEHPDPYTGNLICSVWGEITEINERYVIIAPGEPLPDDPRPDPVDVNALEGEELLRALKALGVDTRRLGHGAQVLIINALNPEPGITWAEPMLATHVRTLQAGLALHQRIARAKEVIIAVPKGLNVAYDGLQVHHVEPMYPNSVPPLLIKRVTGQENPEGFATVSLHTLWGLGRVARSGEALTENVVTLNSKGHTGNYIIKDGTRVRDLLEHANVKVHPGDTVVVGGPLQGASISQLERGLAKHIIGVFVVEAGTIPPLDGETACVNCGACILACPARLSPEMLSRYSEFHMYERCRKEHIEACMECGLCGYVCLARRPVLQYIRLAKDILARQDQKNSSKEL